MAASPFDDPTDEDFFDKLVEDDDDLPIAGFHSESSTICNESPVFAAEGQDLKGNEVQKAIEAPKEEPLAEEENSSIKSSSGSKKTGVKIVQWSSFSLDSPQVFGPLEFGSDSEFLTESSGNQPDSSIEQIADVNVTQHWENTVAANDAQSYRSASEQSAAVNGSLYWEGEASNDIQFSGSASKQNAAGRGSQYWGNAAANDAQLYGSASEQSSDANGSQYWGNAVANDAQLYGTATKQSTDANSSQYWGNAVANDAQLYGSANGHSAAADGSQYWGNSVANDAQLNGSANEQSADANGSQYWENLYPGWKYDHSIGQWYQSEGVNSMSSPQSDIYSVNDENMQEGHQYEPEQITKISHLQHDAKASVETVEDIGSVSNWNQISQGSTGYPANMVFDSQYPDWYYDTNTQQWCMLELYNQMIQNTIDRVHQQPSQANASYSYISSANSTASSEVSQIENNTTNGLYEIHDFSEDLNISSYKNAQKTQQAMWQPDISSKSQQAGNFYSLPGNTANHMNQQSSLKTFEPAASKGFNSRNNISRFQSFAPAEGMYQFSQPQVQQTLQAHLPESYYMDQNSINYSLNHFKKTYVPSSQPSYLNEARSSAGRPPHALVTFGFGGKLIVMKNGSSLGSSLDNVSKDAGSGMISILNLTEVVMDKTDLSSMHGGSYFLPLCQKSFPGPLVGGNAAAKDVYKWLDEKIAHRETSMMDAKKAEALRLLLSLLKISCQHYGKLRSPYGTDPSLEETDGPGSAVSKLFSSVKITSSRMRNSGSSAHYMKALPSEEQTMATALEVQNLLVSGRRKEALHCAQAGQLWGPALVLAAQLDGKYYVETVKHMAQSQFKSGSPLRTLCLLIAGQPADIFSPDICPNSSLSGTANVSSQTTEVPVTMLDDWEENLAIITANRTKDDERVIVHLGDCLWKERGEITEAHTCYLVAETKFESYSDTARLCLIGSDHWKCPRTYASPEAIQRTEIYEYSKVLGNSQFILLEFQAYKLLYAYMLAEVGKVSDSLRYCQASLKLLKNSARSPEVEMLKLSFLSLEERLRAHLQGGYSTSLDPAKLVGKFFTSIDRSINRMMGGPTSPLPPLPHNSGNVKESHTLASSQSTMAMSSLVPSTSEEAINEWTGGNGRKNMHTRSASEPDFGNTLKQDPSKNAEPTDAQGKTSPSRLGRIGSQLLSKVGWGLRARQAKLGESNKFYYDEKLKRWVEEGADPPAEEAALPPPPTMSSFQNATPDYNINSAFKTLSPAANGLSGAKPPTNLGHISGIPPISPSSNQFSARGRTGVRSRYVDTFNKSGGGVTPQSSFQSRPVPVISPAPAVKPLTDGVKFFVPATAPSTPNVQTSNPPKIEQTHNTVADEEHFVSTFNKPMFYSLSQPTSPSSLQHISSMNNLSLSENNKATTAESRTHTRASSWSLQHISSMNNLSLSENDRATTAESRTHTRASSWSGDYGELCSPKMGRNFGDDLHEVAL